MLPPEDIFYEQTHCMPWSLARLYRHTHEHTPCSMIGTDEPSANARAHVEALIYGSVYRTWFTDVYTPMCFHTHTHICTDMQAQTHRTHTCTHFLLTQPIMDDEGPFPGIGELGTDGQDDLQLRRAQLQRVTPQFSLYNGYLLHTLVFCNYSTDQLWCKDFCWGQIGVFLSLETFLSAK